MISKTHQVYQQDEATHSIKTSTKIRLLLRSNVNKWQQVGFFILTYKTKLCVGFFAQTCLLRDCKEYIVSNSG